MTAITNADIDRAARAVRARLERVLEFQIPEDSPNWMEVRRREEQRESERMRRSVGKLIVVSAPERMGL